MLIQRQFSSIHSMADRKVYTLFQVSQHKTKKDCWLVINGRVLNVTKFLEEHPGGEEVLLEVAGKDATKDFDNIGHSDAAHKMLLKYQVGILQGYTFQGSNSDAASFDEQSKVKETEMTGFVIKEEMPWKFAVFIEFFVPIVVASAFFGYRYLAGGAQIPM